MNDKLTVNDLLNIIEQYKAELALANEQKMLFKALLNKQIQINEELRKSNNVDYSEEVK